MVSRIALSAALVCLVACAGPEGDTPSLAARPIEGIVNEPMRAIAPVASRSDAALASRIASLVSQAEAGQSDFAAALPRTRSAVSAAGGTESESWINAQLLVSALDSTRSGTTLALGELDGILAEQTASGRPAETERLITARDRVASIYEDQAHAYEALVASLRSR